MAWGSTPAEVRAEEREAQEAREVARSQESVAEDRVRQIVREELAILAAKQLALKSEA